MLVLRVLVLSEEGSDFWRSPVLSHIPLGTKSWFSVPESLEIILSSVDLLPV